MIRAAWEEGRGVGDSVGGEAGSTSLREAQAGVKSRASRAAKTAEGTEGLAAKFDNLSLTSHGETYAVEGPL